VLIRRTRKLYGDEPLSEKLNNMVYALGSSTIDLCLSVFEWAPFRSTKAAIKLHTLLDLRGAIPVSIHISDGKLRDVNVLEVLPVEAGARYVKGRGYIDFKQRLRIKRFLGTSKNAVKTQIWCAIAKHAPHLKASLYTCLQILSVSALEKTQLSYALQPDSFHSKLLNEPNQLTYFEN